MTVDAVNTSVFDDYKITGIVCVWFVGEKLERVRFDLRALEHVQNSRNAEEPSLETAGEYKVVLDEMADAMNHLAEETHSLSRVGIKRRNARGSQRIATFVGSRPYLDGSPAAVRWRTGHGERLAFWSLS